MTASELDSLKEKLETGEFANSRDVKKLLKYVKEEILTRRHQTVSMPTDEESNKESFDTAKIANSIIRAYKKINPSKWEYVIQNETFIKLAIQLINKMKKLITYQEYTPYNDHAGCDAQCTGLCASCTGTNTGGVDGAGGDCNGMIWNGGAANIRTACDSGYCGNFGSQNCAANSNCGPNYANLVNQGCSSLGKTGGGRLETLGPANDGCTSLDSNLNDYQ